VRVSDIIPTLMRWLVRQLGEFRRTLNERLTAPPSIKAEYLRLLYRNLAASTPISLAMVIYIGWEADPETFPKVRSWMVTYSIYLCLRWLASVLYPREDEPQPQALRWWSALAVLLQDSGGILMGVLGVFIVPSLDLYEQMVTVMVVMILVGGTAFSLSGRWADTLVFAPPIYLSFSWAISQQDHPYATGVSVLTLVLLALHLAYARNHHKSIRQGFELARRSTNLARELQFKNIEFQEVASARSRLLATVSHDLRQPAHAIGLLSERALADDSFASVKETLRYLNELSLSLSASLTTLMDLTRLDAGLVQPRMRPVPLAKVLTQLEAEFGTSAQSKGLGLQVDSSGHWVWTDPVLLHDALSNLVSNAIKYTRQGGVQLRVNERAGVVSVEVSDTGVGIHSDKLELIFKEFVRLDASDAGTEGLGLGLSIVRRYASLLSHQLRVQSRLGEGSSFSISMQRVEPQPLAVEPVQTALPSTDDDLSGLKVLVIDNVELLLVSMCKTLSGWNCQVSSARNLAEALDCARQEWPDVLVTDFHLGDRELDGLELVKALREQALSLGHPHLPALLMTGDVSAQLETQAREAGVQVLHKPVRPKVLRESVLRLISQADKGQERASVAGQTAATYPGA
jgi:signal transduction histidine kinase/CheY-like chemotaxis protein